MTNNLSPGYGSSRRELETSIASAIYAVTRAQFVRIHTLLDMDGETLAVVSTHVDGNGVYWATNTESGEAWTVAAELLSDHPLMARAVDFHVPVRKLEPATGLHLCYYPICVQGKVRALVELKENHRPYDDEDALISSFISLYIGYAHWLDGSAIDPRTGALRQALLEPRMRMVLEDVTAREDVQGCGHCLAILSIDHFAAIVQCYGQLFGDEILWRVAKELMSRLPGEARVFNLAPDGFVILQPASASRQVEMWFAEFLEHMTTVEFPNVGQPPISVGLSQLTPGDTPEGVMARAHAALTKAQSHNPKQIGRPGAR